MHPRPSVKGLQRRGRGKTAEGAGGAMNQMSLTERPPSAARTRPGSKGHSPRPTALLGATARGAGTTGGADGWTRGRTPAGTVLAIGRSAGPTGRTAAVALPETQQPESAPRPCDRILPTGPHRGRTVLQPLPPKRTRSLRYPGLALLTLVGRKGRDLSSRPCRSTTGAGLASGSTGGTPGLRPKAVAERSIPSTSLARPRPSWTASRLDSFSLIGTGALGRALGNSTTEILGVSDDRGPHGKVRGATDPARRV